MARQRFDSLGKTGLNTDLAPSLLPVTSWETLRNIQCADNSLRSTVGERKLFDVSLEPLYHTTFMDGDKPTVIICDGSSVLAYQMDGTEEDITPQDELGVAEPWLGGRVTFTNLNGVLVVNSESDGPFYWAGTGSVLAPLPGWNTAWRCRAMCAYRYYLVAVGMIETISYEEYDYKHKVRWSSSAAEGDIPTLWEPALDNDAGDDLLGETPGALVGGVLLRDSLILVKEDDLYSMNWIGGQYVMQVSRLKGGIGTRAMQGFAEMRGAVATMTTTDVLLFDGNQSTSIMAGRVRESFKAAVSPEEWEKCTIFSHVPSTSLYIGTVPSGQQYIKEVYRYDWSLDTWSTFTISDGYGFDELLTKISTVNAPWDDSDTDWATPKIDPWNTGVYAPSVTDLLIYESDASTTNAPTYWVSIRAIAESDSLGNPKFTKALRTGLPLEGVTGLATVTRVWPEIAGTIPVNLFVGGQMALNEAPKWDGPYALIPGETESVTPRVTGRFICFRLESEDIGWWKLSALTVNHEPAGER